MPSPTESTCPTSATSASVPKSAICCFRMAEISAARISILPDPLHGELQALQLAAERRIDHARAQLDDQAAEQARIDPGFNSDFAADGAAQPLVERLALRVAERLCRDDLRRDLAAPRSELGKERLNHLRQHEEPPVLGEEAENIA